MSRYEGYRKSSKQEKGTGYQYEIIHICNSDTNRTIVEQYVDKRLLYVKYKLKGELHRENDKPALLKYKKGRLVSEEYYICGNRYREGDLPSIINYYDDGSIENEHYMLNDVYYREDEMKPTYIQYDSDGFKYDSFDNAKSSSYPKHIINEIKQSLRDIKINSILS